MRLTAILIALAVPTSALAQPAGEVIFELPMQWTSGITDATEHQQRVGGSAAIDYLFGGERGRIFYEMTLDTFATPEADRTWLHNGGITGTFGGPQRSLTLGGSAFWRANEGTWSDAGFRGVNLLAALQLKPREPLAFSGSYALYARAFPDQSALDQVEHFGSWRALANLPSRTTLVGAVTVGRKSYDGRELVLVETPVAIETPAMAGALGSQGTMGGRGFRQGGFIPIQIETIGGAGTRTQWSWAARVAQSLDDRTGLWIEREQRRTSGDLPPAIVWTPPMFYEDGVYDDPYVIDADTWRAGVKHVFANGAELGGTASVSDRTYAGLTRADRLTRGLIDSVWPLVSGRSGSLDAIASYSYFHNASSEPGESYRAHQFSAGIRIGF